MDLPAEAFTKLCSADNLYIFDEKVVVDLIDQYLKHRDDLPPLKEEDPKQSTEYLTPEELAKREEEKKKHDEEEKKKHDEEQKKRDDEYAKESELGKIQINWDRKIEQVHKDALDRLALKRLNKDQREHLFKTIRYSYLHHEQLLALTMNKQFDLAKNFIVEGLAFKL